MDNDIAVTASQDSKNIALLTWIGTIFFNFIPALVVYLWRKDDAYVQDQAKEALNWSITALFGYLISYVLMFIAIGFLTTSIIWLINLVFCIMGAVATSNGKQFRVPFALRLIK